MTSTYSTERYQMSKEQRKEYYAAHREHITEYMGQYRSKVRLDAMQRVPNGKPLECSRCRCDSTAVLEINHKNGGGSKERKLREFSGQQLYYAIIKGNRKVDDLELLCRVCNALDYVKRLSPIAYDRFSITWKP